MYKKLAVIVAVIFLAGMISSVSYARSLKAMISQKASAEEEMKAIESKTHAALKDKEWIIYLHDRDGGKGAETDVLTFTDETVTSRNLSGIGYPASNFGLFVNLDGSASWETMQTNPATKDKAFLRGEVRGSAMTGTIFMKPVKGRTSTFIFSTTSPAAAPAASGAASATTTKKSKR